MNNFYKVLLILTIFATLGAKDKIEVDNESYVKLISEEGRIKNGGLAIRYKLLKYENKELKWAVDVYRVYGGRSLIPVVLETVKNGVVYVKIPNNPVSLKFNLSNGSKILQNK